MRNVVRGEELTTNYRQDHISDLRHSILIWYNLNNMQDWIAICSTFLATLLALYAISLFIRIITSLISITGTTSTRVQIGFTPSTARDKNLQKVDKNQTRLLRPSKSCQTQSNKD